jgi:NTE family protein
MQDRITRTRLAGDPPDVLLCPRLGEFSWLDFHRANEAIAEGFERRVDFVELQQVARIYDKDISFFRD